MNLIIHRGTNEIGGSCIELQSQGASLLLDIGMPLLNPDRTPFDEDRVRRRTWRELVAERILPPVPGLYDRGTCAVAGVVLSHSHPDHYGLGHFVRPDVPIYASPGTRRLIELTREFVNPSMPLRNLQPLKADWKPVRIGPFVVRAHPVDHSAPDAIAVEVVADGRRVFYSGDLRGHGRARRLFEHMTRPWRLPVHALLMEGSSLGRPEPEFTDEESVEKGIAAFIKDQRNLALIFASGQNPDRTVSAYNAARSLGRTLVVDLYGAYVLHLLRDVVPGLPQYDSDGVRVKFYRHHQAKLIESGHGGFVETVMHSGKGIRTPELVERRAEILMMSRSNSIFPRLMRNFPVDGLRMIWSMWPGYLPEDKYVKPFCDRHRLELRQIHVSGHASPADLRRLVQAVKPRTLIPIHTLCRDQFDQFGAHVKKLDDGEVLEV